MTEHSDLFYLVADLQLGDRVHRDGRHGSIVRRAARLWVDRDARPPMVRWDGEIDAKTMSWEDVASCAGLTIPAKDI